MSSLGRPRYYQPILVGLLSLNFGILFFDRNALSFLMPFVAKDLALTNLQIGLCASALAFAWAISGFVVGHFSDKSGQRKAILIAATFAFSVLSLFSGLATTFAALFATRLLMGFAEGGVLPVSQSITSIEVDPEHRGVAMGVMQNLGSMVLGSTVAPLTLVWLANNYGWRQALYVTAVPGIISAIILWFYVRKPEVKEAAKPEDAHFSILSALKNRNIILCMVIATLLIAFMVVCFAFMPVILTANRALSPDTMSWIMAALGISAGLSGFIIPWISDTVGRRPTIVVVSLIGAILPLSALYFQGSTWVLAALFFIGWFPLGVFPLFMATIPSETVGLQHTAKILGIVMGTGEILGGVFSPFAAGAAADAFGLTAPLWIMLGLCATASVLALGLQETAPNILKSRHAKNNGVF